MKNFAWLLAAGAVTGLCTLTGCTTNFSSTPAISSFVANPVSTASGGPVSLIGTFNNGTGVITPGNIAVTSGTAVTVSPTATTTYTLTVTGVGKIAAQTATITVNAAAPAPTITGFTANPATIATGGSSSLTAVFGNGTGVITPGNIAVTSGTAVMVSPAATITYTLTVTDGSQTATQTAAVTVGSTTGWYTHIGCEGGTLGAQVAQGGADEFSQTFSSTVYSNTEVGTGSESCQMGITEDSLTNGWGQWGAIYQFPSTLQNGSELWARVSLFVPAGFDVTTNDGMLKFMRVHTASPGVTNEGYHDLLISNPGFESWSPGIGDWAAPYIYNYEGAANLIGVGTVPANNFATGQWETYEMYIKLSPISKDSGGQGEIRIWKNNQLLLDRTSAPTLVQATSFADFFYLFTYWNGNAPATQSLHVDDVIVTSQIPSNTDANGYPFIGAPVMTSSSGAVVNGACGSANGIAVSNPPSSNLCSSGTASVVSDSGPWSWMCIGSNGGATASCSTNP